MITDGKFYRRYSVDKFRQNEIGVICLLHLQSHDCNFASWWAQSYSTSDGLLWMDAVYRNECMRLITFRLIAGACSLLYSTDGHRYSSSSIQKWPYISLRHGVGFARLETSKISSRVTVYR